MSRSPVREALKQLAALGLANYCPHRGSVVRRLTAADPDLMFEAIAELASSCARYAALRVWRSKWSWTGRLRCLLLADKPRAEWHQPLRGSSLRFFSSPPR